MTRAELDHLHDLLYGLEAAIEDVERDREAATTVAEYAEALDWLLEAAKALSNAGIGSSAD